MEISLYKNLNKVEQIEWIGWILTTEKSICLSWNKKRTKIVPKPIIDEYYAAIMINILDQ